ncbi:MAG: DUF4062 domain-containing protein [Hyphomicrobiaceae bacterium]|nr:DUF4062 domain-containing protein [Hyphomicrobiaceae bacterium]
MNKRYQVFLSSTYTDLQEARSEAIQALLELDCMPAGMELFPAANDQQWSWIKKIIDESDYYVVIVGGRYGTLHPEKQISYTEMEYRYAIDCGKPIIAFIHEDPGKLPSEHCEATPEGRDRLMSFRQLCERKVCKYWSAPTDLSAKLSRSLTQLMKHEPRGGWVKSNAAGENMELELLKLREENASLKSALATITSAQVDEATIASGADVFHLEFHCELQTAKVGKTGTRYWVKGRDVWDTVAISWDQIFFTIIPALIGTKRETDVYALLNVLIHSIVAKEELGIVESERILQLRILSRCGHQIRMQLIALGLIAIESDGYGIFWKPTLRGMNQIVKLGALKKGHSRALQIDDIDERL